MKNLVILCILGLFAVKAIANNNIANNELMQTSSGWDESKVKKFVRDALNINLMEVQAGQLAVQNATSQQIKDYAQMMIQDHTASTQKLQSVVSSLNIDVPTTLAGEHQSKVDRLRNTTNFDKDYIDQMVKDHKDAIKDFEEAQENVKDPGLQSWISNALTTLRKHQDEAQKIKDQLK